MKDPDIKAYCSFNNSVFQDSRVPCDPREEGETLMSWFIIDIETAVQIYFIILCSVYVC